MYRPPIGPVSAIERAIVCMQKYPCTRRRQRENAAQEIERLKAIVAERDAEIEDLRAACAKPVEAARPAAPPAESTPPQPVSRPRLFLRALMDPAHSRTDRRDRMLFGRISTAA